MALQVLLSLNRTALTSCPSLSHQLPEPVLDTAHLPTGAAVAQALGADQEDPGGERARQHARRGCVLTDRKLSWACVAAVDVC